MNRLHLAWLEDGRSGEFARRLGFKSTIRHAHHQLTPPRAHALDSSLLSSSGCRGASRCSRRRGARRAAMGKGGPCASTHRELAECKPLHLLRPAAAGGAVSALNRTLFQCVVNRGAREDLLGGASGKPDSCRTRMRGCGRMTQ